MSPTRLATPVGWMAVGVAATALPAIFPWVAAYSQLPSEARNHLAWVTPLLAVGGITAAALAATCWMFNRTIRSYTLSSPRKVVP